ncbi:FtsK/SpoIIIE domain-containing protein [Streptomyces sp. AA1529]|uniref:FtsK/SpoIIIE domain-containing protein n=1 Tax=Streptomyces sp. AA1529 TaxID=1203257 RepID=UPI00030FC56A|nr:FtsK/SpoIIIE domain-containing protein [Streptomyces sp. AA1529]
MTGITLAVWLISAGLIVALLTQRWWEARAPRVAARLPDAMKRVRPERWPWRWFLLGYPVLAVRIMWSWRRVCSLNGLAVSWGSHQQVLGRSVVQGTALRPRPPRLSLPLPTATGARVRVILHPGQTPTPFLTATQAMEHAWRVHSVRVTSPERGRVLLTVSAQDPLTGALSASAPRTSRLLAVPVGAREDGDPWVINFRRTPHWLVTGATQSGKSSLLAALAYGLAPQPVALVGIDLKGGVELGLLGPRLTALATTRPDAVRLLGRLLREIRDRMALCREAGTRSVWDLPECARPVPVVVLVDELAELYLTDGSRQGRDEAEECGTLLLRLAQLGAALGVHLVAAGQRVGSDLGPRVTALRSQLGGRVAHRAHDAATAEMTLGDVSPDAVTVTQTIGDHEQGVAVISTGGRWTRARSTLLSADQIASRMRIHAPVTPEISALAEATERKEGNA